jgi:hypothetical protein
MAKKKKYKLLDSKYRLGFTSEKIQYCQILHYSTFKQCFGSGFARIPIDFAHLDLDPDPY